MIFNLYTQRILIVLVSIATFFPVFAVTQQDIDNLAAGQWLQADVPGHKNVLQDVKPAGLWSANVMDPWSGGAYDTNRNRLIVWGGGHGDYSGNEIYVYDVNNSTWDRLTDPSADTGGTEVGGLYPDGLPRSRHTYDFIEYAPPPVDKFFVLGAGGTYPGSQIKDPHTHAFDFITKKWNSSLPNVPTSGSSGSASAYNPKDGAIYYVNLGDGALLQKYDPVNKIWTVFNNSRRTSAIQGVAAIDPTRNIMIVTGSYQNNQNPQIFKYDLSNPDKPPVDLLNVTTGSKTLEAAAGPGFAYDPVTDNFVAWHGGVDVYLLKPDTWVWTKKTLASAPANQSVTKLITPVANSNGTYGRFQYIPSKNMFIVVNSIKENVYFFKLSDNGGALPWLDIQIHASSTKINPGDSVALTWQADNAVSCEATGGWSGPKPVTGMQTVGPLQESTGFQLDCSGDSITASRSILVEVDGDVGAPKVTYVKAATPTSVTVTYSEAVNKPSAETASNYLITPNVNVQSAQLQSNGGTVILTVDALTEGIEYTLSVRNVYDNAVTPNAVDQNLSYTFIHSSPVAATSPSSYAWDVLEDGNLVYIDRSYVFNSVPAQLLGVAYLRTANNDKASTDPVLVSFSVDEPVTVYIANDVRNSPVPTWLAGWQDTGDEISATHINMRLFSKDFAKGANVQLGGNIVSGGNTQQNSMYVVMVAGKQAETGSGTGGTPGTTGGSTGLGSGSSASGNAASGGGAMGATEILFFALPAAWAMRRRHKTA